MSKIESARKLIEEKKRLLAMKIEQVRTRQQSEEKKKKALQSAQARLRKEPEKWAQSRAPPIGGDVKKWPQKETAPAIEESALQTLSEAKGLEDDLNKSLQTAKFVPPIEDLDSDGSRDSSSSSSSIVQHVSDINEDPGESFHKKEGRTPPAVSVISPPPLQVQVPESSSSGSPPEEPEEEVEIDPKTVTFQLQTSEATEEEKVSDTGQRLKFEVESQIRMIKKTIQKSVFPRQTDDREAQKTQIKQDLLKALLQSKSTVPKETESVEIGLIESDEEVVMRPTTKEEKQEAAVTFGKPLNLGRVADVSEDDVSMVNLEGKKGADRGRYSEDEEEVEIKLEPRRGEMSEVEMFKARREARTEKPQRQVKMRPSQSPRPGTRSPETEEAKEKLVDESKYRRHKNLPKLVFNKPSNRKLIKNAIVQVCLAGEAYKMQREEVLRVIDENAAACNFIIVFRGELGRQDLKALYELDSGTEKVNKLYGPAIWPEMIESGQVQSYYRYDSGAKEFRQLQCRTFSIATDAVVLKTAQKTGKNALY